MKPTTSTIRVAKIGGPPSDTLAKRLALKEEGGTFCPAPPSRLLRLGVEAASCALARAEPLLALLPPAWNDQVQEVDMNGVYHFIS